MENFFIITPVGLESWALEELREKCELHSLNAPSQAEVIKGGIELSCTKEMGFTLNHILKSPTRILWRIKSQKCRDLPKLFNIIKKIKWKEYLQTDKIDFHISCSKSRLIHTKKIEQTAIDAIQSFFNANKIKDSILKTQREKPAQSIYLRFYNDELTISLDTTGERLHIRGEKTLMTKAPLRESFAHILLRATLSQLNQEDYNLIDPMCGSGSFLIEALNYYKLNNREFNYQNFYHAPKIELSELDKKLSFNRLVGLDIDKKNIDILKDHSEIEFREEDLFSENDLYIHQNNIIICNPPYGKRIKIKGPKDEYFKNLIKVIEEKFKPKMLGIIIPKQYAYDIPGEKIFFNQNGVSVVFLKKHLSP